MLDLILDGHWHYIADNCSSFRSGSSLAWPDLESSVLLQNIKRRDVDLNILSGVLTASFVDLLKMSRIRRDAHFLEIGSDVNILFDGMVSYLKMPGQYTLLHTDQDVLDWVKKKSVGSRLKVNLHHIDSVEPNRKEISTLFGDVDFVYDTAQFVCAANDFGDTAKKKIAGICGQLIKLYKPVCTLLPLIEFLPSIKSEKMEVKDGQMGSLGENDSYIEIALGGTKRLIFDEGFLEMHTASNGWNTERIVAPISGFPFGISPETYCCKVLHFQ